MPLPALRNIEAFPVSHEGKNFIAIRDVEGFVEEHVLLSPQAFFIAMHLDGKRDIREIQVSVARQTGGVIVFSEEIMKIVNFLDQKGFLLTEKFHHLKKMVIESFNASENRPAYIAGKSYPDKAEELKKYIAEMFKREGSPGRLPSKTRNRSAVRCLVVPHIDFHRGGHSYAHGYLNLAEHKKPRVAFIFGVAHCSPPVPFVLTKKNFETPLGIVPTDTDIVAQLASACKWDPFEYEFVHRTEHSIEFQAVMLSFLYGDDVKIVPILCSAFATEAEGTSPASSSAVAGFLNKVAEIVESLGDKVCVIAGADLAHVGKRFGDEFDISESIVKEVEARDMEAIEYISAGDAEGFYSSVMKDLNKRRVCGLYSIYSSLKVSRCKSGKMLHYDYAHDPAGGIVSFTNVSLQ